MLNSAFKKFNVGQGITWLAAGAAFFLAFRNNCWGCDTLKIGDALFILLGGVVMLHADIRALFRKRLAELRFYLWSFATILFFILIGQLISLFSGISLEKIILINYARLLFNWGIFFILAFLIARYPRLISYMSIAILISPVTALPAFLGPNDHFLHGGRLMGFLLNPIVFGMWMAIVFLLGIAFYLEAKSWWLKGLVLAWLCVIASFILWSGSRAAWLSLALGLLLWGGLLLKEKVAWKKLRLLATAFLVAFVTGFFLLPNSGLKIRSWVGERAVLFVAHPTEDQIRSEVWEIVISTTQFKNLLGAGLINSTNHAPLIPVVVNGLPVISNSPSNSFLEIMLYGGIGAVFAFTAMIGLFVFEAWRFLQKTSILEIRDLHLAWILAVPTILVGIFFNDGFLLRHTWVVLGMGVGTLFLVKPRFSPFQPEFKAGKII